jgi:hypothetical protein
MRLGKEETKGFIKEPVDVSDARHDPLETDPREGERTPGVQRSSRNAPEDQRASTG